MIDTVHAFVDEQAPAGRLAAALGAPLVPIGLHRFPDGEGLPGVGEPGHAALVYRSLDRPDAKLMPLLLAADALRRRGAGRVLLAAPYLAYLRQDTVFSPGQPLSRDVFCGVLGAAFDAVVTVEPHLHRTTDLSTAFGGVPVVVLSATGPLAQALAPIPAGALVVGPDAESEAWVRTLADRLGADALTFTKVRHGDRHVELTLATPAAVAGRHVVLLDDVCSSGATLEMALVQLRDRGAASVDVAVAHALFDADAEARLRHAGARRIVSTDSCLHPTNAAPLADLIAGAVRELSP